MFTIFDEHSKLFQFCKENTMSKKIMLAVMVAMFAVSGVSSAFAAKVKCKVDSVEGDKVNMTCEDADKLKVGDEVKVKLPKAKAAVEGC